MTAPATAAPGPPFAERTTRGAVAGLFSPHPLGAYLPALFQEDGLAQRFVSAFDDGLAPIFSALDNLDAYLDARYAPEDFLDWLAGWVGVALDENWPVDRRRAIVRNGAELYRLRGTSRGIAAQISLLTDETVEIVETGGAAGSLKTGASLPGQPHFHLTVRVHAKKPQSIDQSALERLVASARPAHVAFTVVVTDGKNPRPADVGGGEPEA